MRTVPRRQLSYASLVVLLAVDVLALTALLFNQWVAVMPAMSWLLASAVTAVTMPWLLKLADKVFDAARGGRNIPMMGEKIPWSG